MTDLQRIQLKQSSCRSAIAALQVKPERTDEDRAKLAELTTEFQNGEVELRAAIIAAPPESRETTTTVDAETRERAEIRSRTGLSDYLRAALSGAHVQGAAAEYGAACGERRGDHMPLALFDGLRAPAPAETRATTSGPAIDGPVQPTVPYLFEAAVVTTLGLAYPSVPPGAAQVPAITTAPPASALSKGATALSTAAAYTLASRTPKRLSGQITFAAEDLALHSALESDLSMALQGSMSNLLDEQVINGNNSSGQLDGLFQQATNVAASGTTDNFQNGLAAFAALVDGRFSRGMSDLRGLVGSATHAAYMALYHGGSGDVTLLEKLRSLMGSLVVSDRMPAVSGGAQKGLLTKNASGRPIQVFSWESVQLIRDPYSGAAEGLTTVTARQLVSSPFIPHGVNQVVEVHRDLS